LTASISHRSCSSIERPIASSSCCVPEVEEILHIRNAIAEEARRLELPANRPMVEIAQTFRVTGHDVDNDTVVEIADIVFAADRYELCYVMEIK
jgi:GntR family transcriptional regulator